MIDHITQLGHQIDEATDLGDQDSLKKALVSCEAALNSAVDEDRVLFHYFTANAFAGIHQIKRKNPEYVWCWEQPEVISEVLALRNAVNEPSFEGMDAIRRCQILTNLANSLDHIGRTIDAIECWESAITIIPNFVMAQANKGHGLVYYSQNLYDPGHQGVFLSEAHSCFSVALSDDAVWDGLYPPEVASSFKEHLSNIESVVNVTEIKNTLDTDRWSLGKSKKEVAYRKWRLNHKLFLNPLNDLGAWPIAARDVFHLPDHTYEINEDPRFAAYYDLLKEEFIAACAFLFEASYDTFPGYADKKVLLFDQFDYVASGLRVQKCKSAFRMAYSILDKVALFINDYFQLGRNHRQISFRNIWYKPSKKGKPPRLDVNLSERKNWPLRGLFALSQDLSEERFQNCALPDAKLLVELRNFVEHRFLSLHDFDQELSSTEYIKRMTLDDFSEKAHRMLKIARSALIYLSWAIAIEEDQKSKNCDGTSLVVPLEGFPREFY